MNSKTRVCSVPDCGKLVNARGWCSNHYQKWRAYGDPLGSAIGPTFAERVWRNTIRTETGCWEWIANRNPGGYGIMHVGSRSTGRGMRFAHRVVYEMFVEPIPEGLEIDHLCRNRACCNPAHLEPVTNRENQRRAPNSPMNRTHCPSGHPYDEANTYWYDGRRYCKACNREQVKKRNERRRQQRTQDVEKALGRSA